MVIVVVLVVSDRGHGHGVAAAAEQEQALAMLTTQAEHGDRDRLVEAIGTGAIRRTTAS